MKGQPRISFLLPVGRRRAEEFDREGG